MKSILLLLKSTFAHIIILTKQKNAARNIL